MDRTMTSHEKPGLTLRQQQVFSVYTGISFCKFSYIHAYMEELMHRPVFTHEIPQLANQLKELAAVEFKELSKEITNTCIDFSGDLSRQID